MKLDIMVEDDGDVDDVELGGKRSGICQVNIVVYFGGGSTSVFMCSPIHDE